jgi:two-component system, cell cycle sensor histidine kinase and response regulator CckA
MNSNLLILSLALGMQLISVFFAIRLMRFAEKRVIAVVFILVASLMVLRRMISLIWFFSQDAIKIDLVMETVGLSISFLILYGIISIARIFRSEEENKNAAAASELRYRTLFDQSPDGVLLINANGDIVDFNEKINRQLGYTREEFSKLRISDVDPVENEADIKARVDKVLKDGKAEFEVKHITKQGEIRDVLVIVQSLELSGQTFLHGIWRDITESKKAEEELKRNEIFIKSILESIDEGFVVVGRDYRIISANKAYCDYTGITMENVIGKYCHVVSHHSDKPCFEAGEQCPVKHTFDMGEPAQFLHIHYDKHRNPTFVDTKAYAMRDAAGNVTAAIEIVIDVTDRKKLEDQYRQAQKMEAIGQLAGGVAHDFNNILSAIIGYGHLSLMKLRDDDPVRHFIDQILQSSDRAAVLTQSLLAFSRKQPLKKELNDLNAVIKNFEKFLQRLLREDIEMKIRYSDDQPVIMADRGQVEQVIMNLVANARDAMPNNGMLTIDARVTDIDEAFIRLNGYGKLGDYAMLSVSDTGVGMNKETQKKIFEPFFTTKEVGKGTGLGLATVYGIVKAHDGFINVYSEPGKGTTFHVYFPLARTKNAVSNAVERTPVQLKGGSETILLAEDDTSLREMTSAILRDMGYTVIDAEDGNWAVVRFKENRATIKLVILDAVMPKKNGLEAYREISALSPKIRCIFMSGYTGEVFAEDGPPVGTEFLPKPIQPSVLLTKVREMLDRQ